MNKVGALWIKDGKKGKFMSGEIEIDGKKTSIMVFKNNYVGENPKAPQYTIHIPEDKGVRQTVDNYKEQVGFENERQMGEGIPF